jgi:hypothetical protein
VYFCAAPLADPAVPVVPVAGIGVVVFDGEGHADGVVWVAVGDGPVTGGVVVAGGVVADVLAEVASAAPLGGGTVRSLWQYRHLIASSWISSAQYGHFFTIGLHGCGTCQLTAAGLRGSPLG